MSLNKPHRSLLDIGHDIRWAIIWVIPHAVFFWLIALIGVLFGLKIPGFTFATLTVWYIAIGLLLGILLGLFRPVAGTMWGATLIAFLVGLAVSFAVRILALGWVPWESIDFVLFFFGAGCIGTFGAAFRLGLKRAEVKERDIEENVDSVKKEL